MPAKMTSITTTAAAEEDAVALWIERLTPGQEVVDLIPGISIM